MSRIRPGLHINVAQDEAHGKRNVRTPLTLRGRELVVCPKLSKPCFVQHGRQREAMATSSQRLWKGRVVFVVTVSLFGLSIPADLALADDHPWVDAGGRFTSASPPRNILGGQGTREKVS